MLAPTVPRVTFAEMTVSSQATALHTLAESWAPSTGSERAAS